MYYRDLRAFLTALEGRGKLYRFQESVDKDSEIGPLLRVQFRGLPEADRQVLLFEHVTNAAGEGYEMQVVGGAYGLTEEIVTLGMGCESPAETFERWHHALEHPIAPVLVESGPVQAEVHLGDDLRSRGLDELPAPVEEPGFSQMIRSGLPMITRDPETGVRNVGTYNGFFHDRDRIVAGIYPAQDAMRYHWQTARRRGEDLPVAIVVGPTPNLMLVGSARIPYGLDEVAVAGGIAGEPIELVRCLTVPLEVPAHAEIVIEGMLSTSTLEPRFAFGEYPGYMQTERNTAPVLRVTAITHRPNAIFPTVLVGFPPSDSNTISSFCVAATVYHKLRYGLGLPVEDVYVSDMTGGPFVVVRLAKDASHSAWQVLHATAGATPTGKFIIVLNHDVNPRDPEMLIWALTWRVRPEMDISVARGRQVGLDPSFGATGSSRGQMDTGGPGQYFRVLIDATTSGVYPPVALPRRDFMERALEKWRRQPGLPEPQLRPPWYGYTLGHWTAEDQQLADLMVQGDYKAVGRVAAALQVSVEQALGH
jgi:4-hydroxy-3-polyprenylbenzoate decarboxylase